MLVGLVCWIYGTYYPILLDEPIINIQSEITAKTLDLIFGENRDSLTEFYYHIFILPFFGLLGTFGFNFLLFTKKQSVAKTLYSTGELSFFGEKFPETLQSMREMKRVPKASRFKSFEVLLWQNLFGRMVNFFKHDFWRKWWSDWVIGKCNPRNATSTCGTITKFCLLFLWVPFSVFLVILHVVPVFSIWENYMRELLSPCTKSKDKDGNKVTKYKRILCFFIFTLQIVGIVMIYAMAWDLISLDIQLAVFVVVDLVRNAGQNIPEFILAIAILGYIQQAFWNFSDKYRELKEGTIQGLRDLHWEYREEYYHYNKKMKFVFMTPPYEVMWEFNDYGEISVPRRFFYEVVNAYRPYKFYVIRMFMKLFITITIVTLLILLIIDFQILGQFTSSGQLLLTLFTVSLPLLIGAVRSPFQRHLSIRRRHLNIRAWAERICRLVTEEKYAVESEEERKARLSRELSRDSSSVDTALGLSKTIALKNSPQMAYLRYWNPTFQLGGQD